MIAFFSYYVVIYYFSLLDTFITTKGMPMYRQHEPQAAATLISRRHFNCWRSMYGRPAFLPATALRWHVDGGRNGRWRRAAAAARRQSIRSTIPPINMLAVITIIAAWMA